ncbi:hypothetical protein RhiTH_000107 [Rhizoctonia solani]
MPHGQRQQRSQDHNQQQDKPPAYQQDQYNQVNPGLLRLLNTVAQTSLETVQAHNPQVQQRGQQGGMGPRPRYQHHYPHVGRGQLDLYKGIIGVSIPKTADSSMGEPPQPSKAVAGQLPGEGASPPSRTEVNNKEESKTVVSTQASTPLNSRSASQSSSNNATGSDQESTAEPTTPNGTGPKPEGRNRAPNQQSVVKGNPGYQNRQELDISDQDPQQACQEDSPACRGQGVGHHGRYVKDCTTGSKDRGQTKDWRRKLPSGTTKASLPGAPVHAGDHGTSNQRPHTGDQGTLVDNQGEQGDFETLCAVTAPKSSVGEDKADSNNGSDGGPKPSATERDDPDVRDTTDHVAKWTTLGPNVEMRDAGNRLKTLEPEQPCVSPRKLELKQLLFPRSSHVPLSTFATRPIAMTDINTRINEEIDAHRRREPTVFASRDSLRPNEYLLLLSIICSVDPSLPLLSVESCYTFYSKSIEFPELLLLAYGSGSFTELARHPSLRAFAASVTDGNARIAGGSQPLVKSLSNRSLLAAFQEPYVGTVHKYFVEALDSYPNLPNQKKLYMRSISVVQSSGMGKSRMIDEAANLVFTIPANIREALPKGITTFPPPDVRLRAYFEYHHSKSDQLLQAEYAILLKHVFAAATARVPTVAGDWKGSELATSWANYLKDGQTDEGVGGNREAFYEAAVTAAEKDRKLVCEDDDVLKIPGLLKILFREMNASAEQMIHTLGPSSSADKTQCVFYFDEAHSLTEPPKIVSEVRTHSPYHNLGTVLSQLVDLPIFFVFLSAGSRLQKFAPSASDHPSLRFSKGEYLIPPFTELPFDVFTDRVLKKMKGSNEPRSLRNACTIEVMSSMGRPLWFVHHQLLEDQKKTQQGRSVDAVVSMAYEKLTSGGVPSPISHAELAALSVRIGITFDYMSPAARETESQQVERHMRVVYAIPEHREYMRTGTSSEPVLAEAASKYLHDISGDGGIAISAPRILADNCQKGFLARGERGELCGRLLMTIAHDIALTRAPYTIDPPLEDPEPMFHRPVPVLAFLRSLFASEHHDTILKATPVSDEEEGQSLELAFKDAFVCFSHFALAEDSDMLSSKALRTALFRGMAMQAKDNQPSIDAVIPIHMGSIDQAITTETTSAINLQFKNRKHSLDCPVDRTITVADAEKPVISIVFEFGETDSTLPRIQVRHEHHRRTRSNITHPDDKHYSFVTRGFGPETYESIPAEATHYYRTILATGGLKDDFPRAKSACSWRLLRELKPAFEGTDCCAKWDS